VKDTTDHPPDSSPLRVLITGGSSGIGAASARRFAAAGAQVAVLARGDSLHRVAAEIGAVPFICDVTDNAAVANTVNSVAGAFGGIDVLVNSAGLAIPTSLPNLEPRIWQQHLDVNLSGAFYMCREAARVMDDCGAIVNVASELSTIGMSHFVAYCAAKAGLIGLTKALAAELAPRITVNAVCPGPVDTPMLRREFELSEDPDAGVDQTVQRIPLGRLATPAEVAEAIYFLAVQAPYATGATLQLDGGSTAV